jgi:hypothetical protein
MFKLNKMCAQDSVYMFKLNNEGRRMSTDVCYGEVEGSGTESQEGSSASTA